MDFQCGYCSTKAIQGNIFCVKHVHIWEKLHPVSKQWIQVKVSSYSQKWFPSHIEKKKLQHDINKVAIYGSRLSLV